MVVNNDVGIQDGRGGWAFLLASQRLQGVMAEVWRTGIKGDPQVACCHCA
jgi:hypothetical protein